jgi:hypothetical protein
MHISLRYAYYLGQKQAQHKLGTAAGPIAYAPRTTRERDELSEDKMVQLWAENDREPFVTGDESGIGMPSSGAKNAGLNDGGMSEFSNGIYGSGSGDANLLKVDKDLRRQVDIQNAFDSNEAYDQSYGPESAATQPHGSKYASLEDILAALRKTAGSVGLGNIGGALKPTASSTGLGKSLNPTANVANPQVNGVANTSVNTNIGASYGSPLARFQGGTI